MDRIQALLEQRANIYSGMTAIVDLATSEKRELTGEENAEFERRNGDLDRLDAQVKALTEGEKRAQDAQDALSEIRSREPRPGSTPGQESDVSKRLRSFLKGETRTFEVKADGPVDFRVLSKLSAGAGANTVKTSFYERLMQHFIEVAGIMQLGPTVLNTTSGEQILVPKTTGHSTASLVAEAGTIAASDPAFGQMPLDAYKYATLFQVSSELLQDTSVDIEGYLSMQAGRAVGNAFGTHAITGTGTNQPNGVMTAATVGVTGAASVVGAFTADNLIDLFYSVIAPYRNSPSAGWLMRDATVGNVRKLKDSAGQYLWQPSLQVGVPDTFLGKPIATDPNVGAVALSARSVAFGDFSRYMVRLVNGVRFERSDDFAFNTDLATYRCIMRADGDLADTTGAIKVFVGNAA